MQELSKALYPSLERFYIFSNDIGNKGAKYLFQGYFPQLKEIYLWNNSLNGRMLKFIVKGVRELEVTDLGNYWNWNLPNSYSYNDSRQLLKRKDLKNRVSRLPVAIR